MINVIASITIKEGRVPEFIEIFKANIPLVLKEKGCIGYLPTMDVDSGLPPQERDENVVTIIEQWETLADLKAHLTAPHMLTYKEKVGDIVVGLSLKVLQGI